MGAGKVALASRSSQWGLRGRNVVVFLMFLCLIQSECSRFCDAGVITAAAPDMQSSSSIRGGSGSSLSDAFSDGFTSEPDSDWEDHLGEVEANYVMEAAGLANAAAEVDDYPETVIAATMLDSNWVEDSVVTGSTASEDNEHSSDELSWSGSVDIDGDIATKNITAEMQPGPISTVEPVRKQATTDDALDAMGVGMEGKLGRITEAFLSASPKDRALERELPGEKCVSDSLGDDSVVAASGGARSCSANGVGSRSGRSLRRKLQLRPPVECPPRGVHVYPRKMGGSPIGVWRVLKQKYFIDGKNGFIEGDGGVIALYRLPRRGGVGHTDDNEDSWAIASEDDGEGSELTALDQPRNDTGEKVYGFYHGVNDIQFTLEQIAPSWHDGAAGNFRVEVGARTQRIAGPESTVFEDRLVQDFLHNGSLLRVEQVLVDGRGSSNSTVRVVATPRPSSPTASIQLQPVSEKCLSMGKRGVAKNVTVAALGSWTTRIYLGAAKQRGIPERLYTALILHPVRSDIVHERHDSLSSVGSESEDIKFLDVELDIRESSITNQARKLLVAVRGVNQHRLEFDVSGVSREGRRQWCSANTNSTCAPQSGIRFDTRLVSGPIMSGALESSDARLAATEDMLVELLSRATAMRLGHPRLVAVAPGGEQVLVPKILTIESDWMNSLGIQSTSGPELVHFIPRKLPGVEPVGITRMPVEVRRWIWSGDARIEPSVEGRIIPARSPTVVDNLHDLVKEMSDESAPLGSSHPFNLVATAYMYLSNHGEIQTESDIAVEIVALDKENRGTWFRLRGGRYGPRHGLSEAQYGVPNSVVEVPPASGESYLTLGGSDGHKAALMKKVILILLARFNKFAISSSSGAASISSPEITMLFEAINAPVRGVWDFQPVLSIFEPVTTMEVALEIKATAKPCDVLSSLFEPGLRCFRGLLRTPLSYYDFLIRSNIVDPRLFSISQVVGTPRSRLSALEEPSELLRQAIEQVVAGKFNEGYSRVGFLDTIDKLIRERLKTLTVNRLGRISSITLRGEGVALTFLSRRQLQREMTGRWLLDATRNDTIQIEDAHAKVAVLTVSGSGKRSLKCRFQLGTGFTGLYDIADHSGLLSLQRKDGLPRQSRFAPRAMTFKLTRVIGKQSCRAKHCNHRNTAKAEGEAEAQRLFEALDSQSQLSAVGFSRSGLAMEIYTGMENVGPKFRFVRDVKQDLARQLTNRAWFLSHLFDTSGGELIPLYRALPGRSMSPRISSNGTDPGTFAVRIALIEKLSRKMFEIASRRLLLVFTARSAETGSVATFDALLSEISLFGTETSFVKHDVASFVLEVNGIGSAGVRNAKLLPTSEGRPVYPALLDLFRKAQAPLPNLLEEKIGISDDETSSPVKLLVDDDMLRFSHSDVQAVAFPVDTHSVIARWLTEIGVIHPAPLTTRRLPGRVPGRYSNFAIRNYRTKFRIDSTLL